MGKGIVVVGSYIVALVMDVDRIPTAGETLIGRNFRQTHGGKGSNQAVQAARLGAEVSFVGKIGNDSFGREFLELCRKENVDSSFVSGHDRLPTASGLIICAQGKNIITIDIGALNAFDSEDIDRACVLFSPETVVMLQLEIPLDAALYAARRGKERGATIILNPAPAARLTGIDLSFVDYLTPNETEARVCLGLDPNESISDASLADRMLGLGCKNVVITLGDKGCLLANGDGQIASPAFAFPAIVDSTGAGDAFNAGLAAALSAGMPIERALRYANATGGLACTKSDTIPAFHTNDEVEACMRTSGTRT
ncbi:MAG: ribokinase [Rhodocyclaceae bacterium]|nr:MAG: ribokinase [Rhodocyclaceae bacterium]